MRTIVIITFLLSFSFTGKAQSFCDTMLGHYFQFEYKQDSNYSSFDFNIDTIDFYRGKRMPYYLNLHLNCKDSSFSMHYALESIIDEGGGSYLISADPQKDKGLWKYDSSFNIISFKLESTNTWKKFKIESGANKAHISNLSYYSDENYKHLIRLIAIKK